MSSSSSSVPNLYNWKYSGLTKYIKDNDPRQKWKDAKSFEESIFKDYVPPSDNFVYKGYIPQKISDQEREEEKELREADFDTWYDENHNKASSDEVKARARQIYAGRKFYKQYDKPGMIELANLIGTKAHGIKYSQLLSAEPTAERWLEERKAKEPKKYGGWRIQLADLDEKEETPDNILIIDDEDELRYVDGYTLDSGSKKRYRQNLISLMPDPRDRKEFRDSKEVMAKRLFKIWVRKFPDARVRPDFKTFADEYVDGHPKLYQEVAHRALRGAIVNFGKTKLKKGGVELNTYLNNLYPGLFMRVMNDTTSVVYYELAKEHRQYNDRMLAVRHFITQMGNGGRFETPLSDLINDIVTSYTKQIHDNPHYSTSIKGFGGKGATQPPDDFLQTHKGWMTDYNNLKFKNKKGPRALSEYLGGLNTKYKEPFKLGPYRTDLKVKFDDK
jgi:hypothetical protein